MSEPEVATKAPESDAIASPPPPAAAAAASLVPGDTPAQSGASLGVGVPHTVWTLLTGLRSIV